MKGTFKLVGFDEGGVNGSSGDRLRLVCNIQGGSKLAIWGNESSRENIDAVLDAGVPCTVECEYRWPAPWAKKNFGHTHWVPAASSLRVSVRG